MAALTYFARHSLTSDAELDAIAHLYNLCTTFDDIDDGTSASELQEDYNDPTFDKDQDLQLWRDRDGTLRAVSSLWRTALPERLEGHLSFFVHPDARGQGLEQEIMAWSEQRMRQEAQGSALPLELQVWSRDTLSDRIALYEQSGYQPVRYFFRMRRSLTDAIPQPQLPEGFQLRHVDPNSDGEAWVDMYNLSFIDHWNHHPYNLEEYQYRISVMHYNPTMDLVAVAEDGTLAAFCYTCIHAQDNERSGRKEGWIAALGTRRGFRRQGLGRAMLLAGLHRLAATGMEIALLGVDAENPSGALGLYQSVGFEAFRRFIAFRKVI